MFSLVATTFLVSKKTMTSAHAVSRVYFFFSNNAGELRVISLRIKKKQRAGKNRRRPKYKELHPNTPLTGSKLLQTTKTLTNLDTI